ncbi:MAG: DUF115 domain-containing protein [Gorillibacterium sp.]|nr:DUF115 domain-containing protein [Gorillibacterium sp.]
MRRPLITFPMKVDEVNSCFEPSNRLTVDSWDDRWLENVKYNLTRFHPLPLIRDLVYDIPNKHVVLVLGAGWTLLKLKAYAQQIPKSWGIVCADRAVSFLLECNLLPDLVVSIDGNQEDESTIVEGMRRLPPEVPVMLDVVCCPTVTQLVKRPYFFRSVSDLKTKAADYLAEYETKHNVKIDTIGHGGNVGSVCVIASKYFLFARHVVLLGMNFSLCEGTRDVDSWERRVLTDEHKFVDVTDIYGRPIRTLANLHNYRLWLELFCHQNDDVEWVNCNDGGYLGVHSATHNYDHFTYETLPMAIQRLGDHGLEEH